MIFGEILIKGKSKEVLISTYICHPSMANDTKWYHSNYLSGSIHSKS